MLKLDRRPHSLRDAVDPALEGTRHQLQMHHVEVNIAERLLPVSMNADLIREVITHLLKNAAKHSPEGTSVRVTAESRGNRLAVSVTDQGRASTASSSL